MDSDRMKAEGYFAAFGEVYTLLKGIPDDRSQMTMDFWKKITTDSKNIARKYEGTPAEMLTKDLVNAVMAEVERIYYK